MTVIKAACPIDGSVELRPGDVYLIVPIGGRGWGVYLFTCPSCGEKVHKQASPRIVDLLRSGGVRTHRIPAEALEPHTGAPINADDLLDLHELLAHDDWIDRLKATH